jgi:hypothetical protein
VGTRKPQQAEEPNDENLADDWKTVDHEGKQSANNRCFDQTKQAHLNFPLKMHVKACAGAALHWYRLGSTKRAHLPRALNGMLARLLKRRKLQ